jgi:hypothetical protein
MSELQGRTLNVIWKRGNEGAGPPYRSIFLRPWHLVVEAIANDSTLMGATTLMAFLLSEGTTKTTSTSAREALEILPPSPADPPAPDPMTPSETRFSLLECA